MGYRRNLFAVTAASFIGFMGFTLVMPFLPLYFHQLGVTDVGRVAAWSGVSLGVTPALTALLSPLWGRLADRFGRKIMIERSLFSFIIVMSAMAFVTKPWHVFALRVIQGLFAGYGALTLTMAADAAPKGKMGQAIGTVQTAQRLGPALGPVLGGTVAAIVGLRRAFIVAAVFYAIALVIVFFMYDERSVHASAPASNQAARAVTFRNVLAFENFVLMAVVIFGLQFVDRSFGPILPLFIGAIGVAPARIPLISGLLFSLAAGAGAVGHHYCAALLKRRTATQLIAAACAVAAFSGAIYVAARDIRWLFLATPIFGFAIGVATTAAYTAAAAVIPPNVRGTGFGLLTTASLIGLAVSPVVSGLLGATSIRAVWALDVVGLLLLALVVHRVGGSGDRGGKTPADEPVAEKLTKFTKITNRNLPFCVLCGLRGLGAAAVGRLIMVAMPHVLRVEPDSPDPAVIREAAQMIREGLVVAYPTDTLYGLAVDPRNAAAVRRLFELKGRPETSALTLIAADMAHARAVGDLSSIAERLAGRWWPGPLTIVVPARPIVVAGVLAGGRTVGIRIPDHAVASALARDSGFCITATSANRTGAHAASNASGVVASLPDVDAVLDAGPARGGAPSTIVDASAPTLALVRAGVVPWERVLRSLQ